MKINLFRIFIISFLFSSYLYSSSDALKVGIFYEKLFTTKKEATIGSKLWIKQMDESNYGKMEAVFYEDEKKLINDFKKNKIQVLLSDATLYYENKKIIDEYTKLKWIMSRSEGMFTQFYLIKNRNSIINLNDFNAKNIYFKENMAKIWFESLFNKDNRKYKSNSKKIKKIEKSKKLIFNIFFNRNDVSIISKDLYDSMLEFNPQIKSKLEIIKKSKPIFFNGIGFTRKNLSEKNEKLLDRMTNDVFQTKDGFEVISFISIQKIFLLNDKDLIELDKFYEKYFKYRK